MSILEQLVCRSYLIELLGELNQAVFVKNINQRQDTGNAQQHHQHQHHQHHQHQHGCGVLF